MSHLNSTFLDNTSLAAIRKSQYGQVAIGIVPWHIKKLDHNLLVYYPILQVD